MTLYPYVMLRVAGLPYSLMEQLRWRDRTLNTYLEAAQQLENDRQSLLTELEGLIQDIEDYPAKYYLKIIRSAIFSGRRIKVKSFKYGGGYSKRFEQVIKNVKIFKAKKKQLQSQFDILKSAYEREVLRSRRFIQSLAQEPILRKGLQMASHSLLKRLDQYGTRPADQFNKKYAQTERTLLQYLSRICTKTSPFSQFTQLSYLDFKEGSQCPSGSKVRLNNQLFRLLQDALTHYPPFYHSLNLRLNASAKLIEEEWVYLLNTRNVESIQRMEHSPIIEIILEHLNSDANLTFTGLRDQLLEDIEASVSEIEHYIMTLVDYGLLEWTWPVSALDPNWPEKLKLKLSKSKDDLLVDTYNFLKRLQEFLEQFANGEEDDRKHSLDGAYDLVQRFKDRLFESIKIPEQDLKNVRTLKRITLSKFSLPKEQLFYEDVSRPVEEEWSQENFTEVAQALSSLLEGIQPLYYNAKKSQHEQFFAEAFAEQAVPLLDYYEAFYKASPSLPESPQDKVKEYQLFVERLVEEGQWHGKSHFHIPSKGWIARHENIRSKKLPSVGSLIQLYNEDGRAKAYVDAVFMGFGKLWGRFLHLFPDKISADIRHRNESLETAEPKWVENIDASIYNPNIHPPLLNYEVQVPGGQHLLKSDRQLRISDLAVRQRPASKDLELWHLPSKSPVMIFDFGFEALENRSPLYRLLTLFSYKLVGPNTLVELLDQRITIEDKQGIRHLPRISFGKQLILRRQGWKVPKDRLPLKAKGEQDFDYFIRLQQWRDKLGLPRRAFIRIMPPGSDNSEKRQKGDHYKPQYIDFESPLFIQLFGRVLPKVKTELLIEEMLPEIKGEKYVKEFLIEMDDALE